MSAAENIPLSVSGIFDETSDVKRFRLALADGSSVAYKAGQFLSFDLEHYGKTFRRSYSICSAPAADDKMEIAVKRIPNGIFSRHLFEHIQIGDVLHATGIAGLFTIPEDIGAISRFFFFAAGIGITPVFSMIKQLLHFTEKEVILIYSNRSIADTAFYKELEQLKADFTHRFFVEYLFSTATQLDRARLNKELLPTIVYKYTSTDQLINESTAQLFYLCGPQAYMRMCTWVLEEMGVGTGQIRKENFETYLPATKSVPPDTGTHRITVDSGRIQYHFDVPYPETILLAAKAQKISLPYSCETGRCGSCVANCISGKVWMSYNEVLTEKDIAEGKVLTCTGYPVGGDVTLRLID